MSGATRKKRILIADDSAGNRELLRTMAIHSGYEVSEAADGASAIEAARLDPPDLILLDIRMPGLDGYAALAVLRKDVRLRAVPVVAVTAHAMGGDREKGLEAGFDEYLAKPVGLRQMRALFEKFLREGKE